MSGKDQGWGDFIHSVIFQIFTIIKTIWLPIEYQAHTWQVSPIKYRSDSKIPTDNFLSYKKFPWWINKQSFSDPNPGQFHPRWKGRTVWCHCNMVIFLPNPFNRHPITHQWGWDMVCLLGIQILIYVLSQLQQWCVPYHAILERVIMVLDSLTVYDVIDRSHVTTAIWWPLGVAVVSVTCMRVRWVSHTWKYTQWNIFLFESSDKSPYWTNPYHIGFRCEASLNFHINFGQCPNDIYISLHIPLSCLSKLPAHGASDCHGP